MDPPLVAQFRAMPGVQDVTAVCVRGRFVVESQRAGERLEARPVLAIDSERERPAEHLCVDRRPA